MTRRGFSLTVSALLAAALVVIGVVLPVPYVVLAPGPVTNTLGQVDGQPVIDVMGRMTYDTSGELNLTTVSVASQLTLPEALGYWFDSSTAVVPREVIFPPNETKQQVEQQNTQEMVQSQQSAILAALKQLGVPVTTTVSVGDISGDSPAAGKLQVGDVITSVDGQAVTSAAQLRDLVGGRTPPAPVKIGYRRGNTQGSVTLPTTAAPGPDGGTRAVIGVLPRETPEYPFKIDIRLGGVGGPSAGLMFALGIIDRLTPADLTGGRDIAGTGEITSSGDVQPIGGIHQKLVGAKRAGATVFLVPADNCAEALQGAPDGLQLVKVASLAGALDSLQRLRTPGGPPPPACTP